MKTTNIKTTRFLWDGSELLAELDGTGKLLKSYVHGPEVDEVLYQTDVIKNETLFFHQDSLQSTLALTDSTGKVKESYTYDPYGNLLSSKDKLGNNIPLPSTRILYTGREFDFETSLYFNRARYYDPGLGRFLNPDPKGYAAGINLYTYTHNNPFSFRDPFGLDVYWGGEGDYGGGYGGGYGYGYGGGGGYGSYGYGYSYGGGYSSYSGGYSGGYSGYSGSSYRSGGDYGGGMQPGTMIYGSSAVSGGYGSGGSSGSSYVPSATSSGSSSGGTYSGGSSGSSGGGGCGSCGGSGGYYTTGSGQSNSSSTGGSLNGGNVTNYQPASSSAGQSVTPVTSPSGSNTEYDVQIGPKGSLFGLFGAGGTVKTVGPINSKTALPSSIAASFGVGAANVRSARIGFAGEGSVLNARISASTLGPPSAGQSIKLGILSISFNTTINGQISFSIRFNAGISTDVLEFTFGSAGITYKLDS